MWRSGSIWDMNSSVLYSDLLHSLSKLSFQYRSPLFWHLLFAGHLKQMFIAFQLDRKAHKDLKCSQSPLNSVTWKTRPCSVIGWPARFCSASERLRFPGRWLGWTPTKSELNDHTSHLRRLLTVRLRNNLSVSQTHSKNREHRIDRGRNKGKLRKKQVIFSFRTLVNNCAASP